MRFVGCLFALGVLWGCGTGGLNYTPPDACCDSDGAPDQADLEAGEGDGATSDGDAGSDLPAPDGADTIDDDQASGEEAVEEPPDDGEESDGPVACTPIEGTGCGDAEICDDGLDNNCNGQVDEGCYCSPGEVSACFRGEPNHRGAGGCADGTMRCPGGEFPVWMACEGGIIESEEVCDGRDNNCDGCIDNIPDCYPSVFCPGDAVAAPLHWFDLVGDTIYSGVPVRWLWTVTPPAGSTTTGAECPTCKNTRVWLDLSGDWLIHLEFTDELARDWTCDFIIHVRGEGIRIEMWWNEGVGGDQTDVDLHLHRNPPTSAWFNGDDCYYSNCDNYRWGYSINWGYPLTPAAACPSPAPFGSDYSAGCPNPRLDLDDVDGNGPENINIDDPRDGEEFRVAVHYYDDEGRESVSAPTFIRIYCGGVVKAMYGPAEIYSNGSGDGDIWRVADLKWQEAASDCDVTAITSSGGGYDIRPQSSESVY